MGRKTRSFLQDWKSAIFLPIIVWLATFFEAGLTLEFMEPGSLWIQNYMIFAVLVTFVAAFIYFKDIFDLKWIEEGAAFGIVFLVINVTLDYGILFLLMESPIFNLQNFVLYFMQFGVCMLAAFVAKKKYVTGLRI